MICIDVIMMSHCQLPHSLSKPPKLTMPIDTFIYSSDEDEYQMIQTELNKHHNRLKRRRNNYKRNKNNPNKRISSKCTRNTQKTKMMKQFKHSTKICNVSHRK